MSSTVHSLQQRISEMQPLRLDDRALPTAEGLRTLLPGGALRRGACYAVHGSSLLSLALIAEASASGSWCGVIGYPAFGAEAAADLGVSLERCVLIPDPGAQALALAGSLSEVLALVVLRHPGSVRPGEAERIGAKLREHGSALIVQGDWPKPETALHVTGSRWEGLGTGHGILASRDLAVRSQDRRGVRHHTVRFEYGAVATPAPAPARKLVAI